VNLRFLVKRTFSHQTPSHSASRRRGIALVIMLGAQLMINP
jgi:hypothetical protein